MTVPTPEQIAKLPKWAREYIHDLERATHDAQRQREALFDSQEKTSILHGDVYENPRYLPDNGNTRFLLGDDRTWIDFRHGRERDHETGYVHVNASSRMLIIPSASNGILLGIHSR